MTTVEKIISNHTKYFTVSAGDTVSVEYDLAVGSDIDFPRIFQLLKELHWEGFDRPDRIALISGYSLLAKESTVKSSANALDHFARDYGISNYFVAGRSGNCQTLLGENGLVGPGDLIVGTGSHITTYGALGVLSFCIDIDNLASVWVTGEFQTIVPASVRIILTKALSPLVTPKDLALHILAMFGSETVSGMSVEIGGDGVRSLDMVGRFTVCNMMAATNVRSTWMPFDGTTEYFLERAGYRRPVNIIEPDKDADYVDEYEIDLSEIVPMVAEPYSPLNGIPAADVQNVNVDLVVIGGCTNGWIQDFRLVADILKRFDLTPNVKLELYPASHQVIRDMLDEKLALFFTRIDAVILPPDCSPCRNKGPNLLGKGEIGLYTTTDIQHNHASSRSQTIYLSGPLVAAAAVVTGRIIDPREL